MTDFMPEGGARRLDSGDRLHANHDDRHAHYRATHSGAGANRSAEITSVRRFPLASIADILPSLSLKRVGQPDDIGDVVAFLASDEARLISGDTVRVDGGSKL